MRKAYYALTGDPITNGHMHVMTTAAGMFDELTVALASNPAKSDSHAFSLKERTLMLDEALKPFNGLITHTVIHQNHIAVRQAQRAGAFSSAWSS